MFILKKKSGGAGHKDIIVKGGLILGYFIGLRALFNLLQNPPNLLKF
jgi:hypothetical protein